MLASLWVKDSRTCFHFEATIWISCCAIQLIIYFSHFPCVFKYRQNYWALESEYESTFPYATMLASFPDLPQLQFIVTCSMQKWGFAVHFCMLQVIKKRTVVNTWGRGYHDHDAGWWSMKNDGCYPYSTYS